MPKRRRLIGELVPIQRVAFRVAVVVIVRILSAVDIVYGERPLGFAAFLGLGLELGSQVEAVVVAHPVAVALTVDVGLLEIHIALGSDDRCVLHSNDGRERQSGLVSPQGAQRPTLRKLIIHINIDGMRSVIFVNVFLAVIDVVELSRGVRVGVAHIAVQAVEVEAGHHLKAIRLALTACFHLAAPV